MFGVAEDINVATTGSKPRRIVPCGKVKQYHGGDAQAVDSHLNNGWKEASCIVSHSGFARVPWVILCFKEYGWEAVKTTAAARVGLAHLAKSKWSSEPGKGRWKRGLL